MNIFLATIEGDKAILNEEESWHCTRVLRKRAGEQLPLIDGKGNFYEARLDLVTDKRCEATILKGPVAEVERNYHIHLAIAPTKQMDRIEWLVEKAVEVGVDVISFVICEHSERTAIKTDRVKKIVLSAVKQSLQATVPSIREAVPLTEFIALAHADQKFIAWCGKGKKTEISELKFNKRSTIVLIGPEGDFSEKEIGQAHNKGFKNLSLGVHRLRTETAGLMVVNAAALL